MPEKNYPPAQTSNNTRSKPKISSTQSQPRHGPAALARIARHHPRLHNLPESDIRHRPLHSRRRPARPCPRTRLRILATISRPHPRPSISSDSVAHLPTPSPHSSKQPACHGTPATPPAISSTPRSFSPRYPQVATANIYTAAILADESTVRTILLRDPKSATAKGGPHGWDALTHLCFSRYLRLDPARSVAFVRTARPSSTLEPAPTPAGTRPTTLPAAGASSRAPSTEPLASRSHAELTRLLLDRGADPNDGETPYHVPESYDNTVVKLLLESGKLNPASITTMLLRKADWHDDEGLKLILEHGADPNAMTIWGHTALHQSLRRDNGLIMIEMLMDHGGRP